MGRHIFWKLYIIENLYRIIIHSVLSVQINPTWWPIAADPTIRGKAHTFLQNYLIRPWHTTPGQHEIYYIDLKDLNEIVRSNANLFAPIIPDIHDWIAKIESIRLPRNITAHMNFPNRTDKARIDVIFQDFERLIPPLQQKINLVVPN